MQPTVAATAEPDVRDDEIERAPAEHPLGVIERGGGADFHAFRLEQLDEDVPDALLVLDDEDPALSFSHAGQ